MAHNPYADHHNGADGADDGSSYHHTPSSSTSAYNASAAAVAAAAIASATAAAGGASAPINGTNSHMPTGGAAGGSAPSGILRTEAGRQQYVTSMKGFWQKQLEVIESTPSLPPQTLIIIIIKVIDCRYVLAWWCNTETDFKKLKHQLPLARIKKIMKSDEDVRVCAIYIMTPYHTIL